MTPLLEQLRAKAKAATPGPWHTGHVSENSEHSDVDGPDGYTIADVTGSRDAAFIIAANPETILKLLDALEVMGEALSKIAVPRSHVTDGSDTKEEYEELYDFWHAASSEKLDAAQKVLNRAKELLK